MAFTYATNEYQIPRGRVFFDPFDANDARTGERYLGNCPAFTVEIASEKAEHYSSESGLRQKDRTVVIQVDRTATLRVDNLSLDNLALFISGDTETVTQGADTGVVEELKVLQDRFYQLGITEGTPAGARAIDNLVVKSTAEVPVTYELDKDYEVDEALGRLHILAGGDIAAAAAETIECTYDLTAASWLEAATGDLAELRGAIRFEADNATGDNRDIYMPSVTLTPTGSMSLVSDGTDFNALEFSLDILKPANGAAIYVDGRPLAGA